MRAPATQTPEAFCELVFSEWPAEITTLNDLAKKAHVSSRTLSNIKQKKIPDLQHASVRQKSAWIRAVSQLSDVLGLDMLLCLSACGLQASEQRIQEGKRRLEQGIPTIPKDTKISKEDLEALLKLVEIIGKPITLSFALDFLQQQRNVE